ncbi:hypothetical protein G3I01_15990 [Gramella sp. MT6]|uniref:hypothetical protein n=1 Tax=Gramella sp. MT6 TaxID=2705471 RepID=UPI001C5E3E35|nr:hypothetical protein [Gramella sp. MT6]QYA26931.1 hypothetical protein G3I01_15990 [Gramella sp. MT6]
MKKLVLLLLTLTSINSYCQKNIAPPENQISERFYEKLDAMLVKYDLEDLRESEEKAIRIWKNNEIILLNENPLYTFYSKTNNEVITKEKDLENVSDIDSKFQSIKNNLDWQDKNDVLVIDASPITIELNSKENYRIISFYKNDQLMEIIRAIRKENSIDELRKNIIRNLSPGNYALGMTSIKVDHLPQGEKTDFYAQLSQQLKEELNIDKDSDPTKMPLVLIDNKPGTLRKLNELELKDVSEYKILKDAQAFYGSNARHGVIQVYTK